MDLARKKKQFSWGIVISCIVIAVTVLPIAIASAYAFYQVDDFTHAMSVGVFKENIAKLFMESLKFAGEMYQTWQGTYTAMFLQAFLSPLNGLGSIQLRVIMVFNVLLFAASTVYMIYMVGDFARIGMNRIMILMAVCIVGVFGFVGWTEIFNWFSGAVAYSFPLSLCFLGIAVMIRAKSWGGTVLAAALMFAASGGSLEVAGTGCFMALGLCIIKTMLGKANRRDYIVFGIALIGALINVAAPGNYVRHSLIDSTGLHLGTAAMGAVSETVETIEDLIYNTPFILFLAIAFVVGIKIGKEKMVFNRKCLYMLIFLSSVLPFVTCFPVCMGYSGDEYFPNRCKFVETVVIVVSAVMIAVAIGCLANAFFEKYLTKEMSCIFAMFFIIMANINPSWKLSETVPYQMWKEIADGEYKRYYDEVNEIYAFIANDENEDVFIFEEPETVSHFSELHISEDMSDWVNEAIASYYRKQSVQAVYSNVFHCTDGTKVIRIYPGMFDCGLEYVSIFKVDSATQEAVPIQILSQLESNMVIKTQEDETGNIAIYIFEDIEGKNQIGEAVIGF